MKHILPIARFCQFCDLLHVILVSSSFVLAEDQGIKTRIFLEPTDIVLQHEIELVPIACLLRVGRYKIEHIGTRSCSPLHTQNPKTSLLQRSVAGPEPVVPVSAATSPVLSNVRSGPRYNWFCTSCALCVFVCLGCDKGSGRPMRGNSKAGFSIVQFCLISLTRGRQLSVGSRTDYFP